MKNEPRFRWIEVCVYEVGRTGYRVERMADCTWEAYLPDAWGFRLWQSVRHSTRASAAMAISAERRRVAKRVREAIEKEEMREEQLAHGQFGVGA